MRGDVASAGRLKCTCVAPGAELLRPSAHQTACPVFIARCPTCDGNGYLIKVPKKAPTGGWKAVTADCPKCNATGASDGSSPSLD